MKVCHSVMQKKCEAVSQIYVKDYFLPNAIKRSVNYFFPVSEFLFSNALTASFSAGFCRSLASRISVYRCKLPMPVSSFVGSASSVHQLNPNLIPFKDGIIGQITPS